MYQSSAAFGNLIQKFSRTFKAKLVVGSTEIENGIKSIVLKGGSNSGSSFVIGSCISQYIEVELANPPIILENKEIKLEIGSDISTSVEEYLPMGYFTAERPEKDEGSIKFTAYDRMMKTERAYFSDLPSTTTTVAILQEMGTFLKIPIVTNGLKAISLKRPDGYTCREVLSYISQMYAGFAVCNRSGQIEIKTYKDSSYSVRPEKYWDSFTHNDFPYTFQKIICYTGKDENGKDISISAGSGMRELVISNPFMTQAALNDVYALLKSFSYMPGSLRFLGDPRVDVWDILTVVGTDGKSYKVPVMNITQDFDGGITTEVEAVGESETEQEQGFKGPQTKAIDRYAVKLALVDHAIVNKLDVNTANITYAKIVDLEATNAKIAKLETEELTAIKANIQTANINLANINNLLAGNAGVGDLVNIHLTTQNAVIDSALIKTAVIQTVTVSDLLAGTISTNKFTIASDDGGIRIVGPTQQWTDKNGKVRMQAGRDAQGNFTFSLFDASGTGTLIDAAGIHAGAIGDKIIVDKMVADNANISGSKLDINSVFSEYNSKGTVTIKSTKIWLDDKAQTLNVALANMSTGIITATTKADDAKKAADGVVGTATEAMTKALKAEASVDGFSVSIGQIKEQVEGIVSSDGALSLQTYTEGGHVGDQETATVHAKITNKDNKDITKQYPANRFLWQRNSEDADGDAVWNSRQLTGYSLTLTGKEVFFEASMECQFSIPDEYQLATKDGSILTTKNGESLIALCI